MRAKIDLRGRFERHRKDTRFVAAGLGLLLVVFTAIYYAMQRGRDLPDALVTNKVLLFALRNANFVLILVIVFVLSRNLLRLWLDRRQRVLGARFKTKLIATYVGLSLLPVMLLFFYGNELLKGAIDRWFSDSLRTVLEQSNAVAQALQTEIDERDYREAARLARALGGVTFEEAGGRPLPPGVGARLERAREESGVHFLGLYRGTEFLHAVVDPRSGLNDLPEVGRQLLTDALDSGRSRRVLLPAGTRGRLILAAAAAAGEDRRRLVVVAGTMLDPAVSATSEELIQAYQSYRQLEVQKREFAMSYRLIFILVTLLILLTSSWVGLFLARRLMQPIQELALGTRRISTGDLDHRIEVAADDEMAGVVESFNRMTAELKRNREEIERSQRELLAANRGLAEERALVSAILENLAAGVIAIDPTGRILSANRAALTLLRQREDDLVGKSVRESWSDDERARLADLVTSPDPGPPEGVELALLLGGERRTFEVKRSELKGAAAPGEGSSHGQVVVIEDQSDLVKAQKLAAWTEAARRIAHEIKNPLTPIRLAAERLRVRHRAGDPGIGKLLEESVDVIVREVATMQGLVDEFSRYARMPGPQLAATDLAQLVGEVLALYRDVKPGVAIRPRLEPGLGEVWIDPEQIRRVLLNLLDNALEASEAPGEVAIDVERRGEKFTIAVADEGRGIAAEDRDKLFLPFFSRKRRGTGMGLAIVQRIVADHNGTIRVSDNRPKGTVFTLELPVR